MNSGFAYRDQIGPAAEGETVLAYLTRRYRHTAEAEWRSRVAAGEVTLEFASAAQAKGRLVSILALLVTLGAIAVPLWRERRGGPTAGAPARP